MRDSNFNHRIEALQQWVYKLQRRAGKDPAHLEKIFPDAFEELHIRLEELLEADKELRQQKEELIASQQVMEAERQHYQGLFDFAPDGYLVTNASGIKQEANRAAAALLSVPQGFLLGIPLIAFVAKGDCRAVLTQLTQLKKWERVQDWEVYLQPHKGTPFPSVITVAAVRGPQGRLIDLRWLIRDITEHKRMEEALRKAHNELEMRVQERTAELVKANEALHTEILGRKLMEGALGESEEQYRH